uniref:Putative LOC100899379 [Metaseiulus occidentalis] n=1 Tax=Lepeophtheirus salmonis TaxID=72036 RepID=A0A0K2UV21_LEPSM
MPKILKLRPWIAVNGGDQVWDFHEDTKILNCRLCYSQHNGSDLSKILRHVRSGRHTKSLDLLNKHLTNESLKTSDFISDMTKMLVSCNIPFSVVEHPKFISFMEKYTGKSVPSRYVVSKSMEVESSVIHL